MKLHLPKALFTAVIAAFAVSQTVFAGGWDATYTNTYYISTNETIAELSTEGHADNDGAFLRPAADAISATITTLNHVAGKNLVFAAGYNASDNYDWANLTIGTLNIGDGTGSCAVKVGTGSEGATEKQNVTIQDINGTISTLEISSIGQLTIGQAGDTTTTYTIEGGSVNAGGSLILAGGITTLGKSSGGDQQFDPKGEIVVKSDATLKFGKTDVLSWGKNVITLDGGTWDVGGTRQSLGGDSIINLIGGTIKDDSLTYGSGHGALDFAGSGSVINSSGNSSIAGGIRLRGDNVKINVTDGVLSVDTFNRQNNTSTGGIIKQGEGTLKITTMATNSQNEGFYAGNTTLEAGTIEYAIDKISDESTLDGSYTGTISGTGNIAKSGTGTVTLANINGLDGDITVSGGTLNVTALAATKTIDVNIAGGTLNIGAVTVDVNEWVPSTSSSKYYVYETQGEGDDATTVAVESTTGNGFYADESSYLLFNGYEWTGTVGGYTTSQDGGNTYLTANGDITTIYHVTNGTVNMSSVGLTPTDTFTGYDVYSGATLDYAGSNPERLSVNLRAGATLANTGAGKGDNLQQLKELTLTGDATVNAANDLGLVGQSYAVTTLDLDGNKLTKTGSNGLLLINTEISAGELDIQSGSVRLYNQGSGGLSVSEDLIVNIAQGTALYIQGNKKDATINGDFLLKATGTGDININNVVNMGNEGGTSSFAGNINVNSDTLRIGQDTGNWNNMVSVTMNDATINLKGGGIRYYGGNSSFGTLNVKQNATLDLHATHQGNDSAIGALSFGTVSIDSGKTLTVNGEWKADLHIGVLTGAGSLNVDLGSRGQNKWVEIGTVNAGFGSITNAGTMTLGTASTTVNLGSTVTNTGTVTMLGSLVLSGDAYADFTVSGAQYDTTGDAVADAGATDGYLVSVGSTSFSVVSGGTINKDGITSVTYNGETVSTDSLSIADNKLTLTTQVAITPTKDYHVNTTVDYAAESVVASDATTGIILNGGTLNLNTALNSSATKGIVAAQDSTINIASGVTLNNSSVSSDGGTATIAGDSTAKYSMGVVTSNSANATMNAGIGQNWKGTVVFESGTTLNNNSFDLDTYANGSNSTVEIAGATGFLGHNDTIKDIDANIKLSGSGLSMTDGYTDKNYTFNGDFSGEGNFTMGDITRGTASFTFKGDMSGWTGTLQQNGGTGTGWTWNYEAADGKNTTIANDFALNKAAGVMNVNVTNAAAVEMTGDVTSQQGTIKLTKDGGSKLTVNNIAANGGNVVLTGTDDNAIEVGNMSIKAGNTVTGAADVTVTNTLTINSSNAISLDGALVLTGATVDLSGFTLDTTTAQDTYVYTLGTAAGGINPDDPDASISFTGINVDGYTATLAAMATVPTAGAAMLADVSATNNYLVLTLVKDTVTPPPAPELTQVTVTGAQGYDAASNVLTLTTNIADIADYSGIASTLAATVTDSLWEQLVKQYGIGTLVNIALMDEAGNLFDLDGTDNVGTGDDVALTINGIGVNAPAPTYSAVGNGAAVGPYVTSYIPEPTTGTLSILALAGLMIRRRRR